MAGSDVESTVESMFSMNSAQATISGSNREGFIWRMAGLVGSALGEWDQL
jgi:hypothetical protein